jgi:hypothetical protein
MSDPTTYDILSAEPETVVEYPLKGIDFDVVMPDIICLGDRYGARIIRIWKSDGAREVRVLGHSRVGAQVVADNWFPERLYPQTSQTPQGWSGAPLVRDTRPKELRKLVSSAPFPMPRAHERRLVDILASATEAAVARVNTHLPNGWRDYRNHIEASLLRIIPENCDRLLAASAVSDAKRKALAEAEAIVQTAKERAQALLSETRRAVAKEMKSSRARLRALKQELKAVEKALFPFVNSHCELNSYPVVPVSIVDATKRGEGVPDHSGIYFVWNGARVVYVGQSVRLSRRCLLGGHHALMPGDRISWVAIEPAHLNFAECFYIGLLKPERNFGWNSHAQRTTTAPGKMGVSPHMESLGARGYTPATQIVGAI